MFKFNYIRTIENTFYLILYSENQCISKLDKTDIFTEMFSLSKPVLRFTPFQDYFSNDLGISVGRAKTDKILCTPRSTLPKAQDMTGLIGTTFHMKFLCP